MTDAATVAIASIQASSEFGQVAANTAKFSALCREAVTTAGAKILVLPETAISGYLSQDLETNWCLPGRPNLYPNGVHPATVAEAADGPIVQHFCTLAQELQCYITVPFIEVEVPEADDDEDDGDGDGDGPSDARGKRQAAPEPLFYNAISLVGPKGTVCTHYRKNFPWPHPERSWAARGTDGACFDTEYGRVGLAVCYDIHGMLAKYARHKIWALLHCVAWVGSPGVWFTAGFPERLKEVSCPHYVISTNWSTDTPQRWPGAGFSTHYGPYGEVLACTSEDVGSKILVSAVPVVPGGRLPTAGRPGLNLDKYAAWTSMQMAKERTTSATTMAPPAATAAAAAPASPAGGVADSSK